MNPSPCLLPRSPAVKRMDEGELVELAGLVQDIAVYQRERHRWELDEEERVVSALRWGPEGELPSRGGGGEGGGTVLLSEPEHTPACPLYAA